MDNLILQSAKLCQQSYSNTPNYPDYARFDTADKTDTAFVFKQDGMQHIVIRGTDSLGDWLQNLQFMPDPEVDGYKVHGGFSRGARELTRLITPHLSRELEINITGHSLGGAISILMSMELCLQGFIVSRVDTFGAPRPFDNRGANLHKGIFKDGKPLWERTTQVRNGNDIVCRVLLSNPGHYSKRWIGAFHPHCNALHVDHEKCQRWGPNWWEAVRSLEPDTIGRVEQLLGSLHEAREMVTGSAGDHAIWNYITALGG